MKLNLRETLLITLLLVALVPVLALSILNLWSLSSDEIEDRNKELQQSIKNVHENYQVDLSRLKKALTDVSKAWSYIDTGKHEPGRKRLQVILATLKDAASLDFLTYLDKNGNVIARSNSSESGDLIDLPDVLDAVTDGKTIVSPEIIPDKLLKKEGKELLNKTTLYKLQVDQHDKTKDIDTSSGIFVVGVTPIYKVKGDSKELIGVLYAGKLLSKDYLHMQNELMGISSIRIDIQPASIPIKSTEYLKFITIKNIEGKDIANLICWYNPTCDIKILTETQKTSLFVCIITSLLVLLASFIISKYLSEPLKRLDDATKEIVQEKFDTTVNVKGPLEIEHLSNAFNKMTTGLAEKRRMQENFIATLTHDMRVPLLGEQKALALLISDAESLSGIQKELLENMVTSNQDLLKLVNTLLDTYKLEAGKYRLDLSEHNIFEVVDTTLKELRPLAEDKSQKLSFNSEGPEINLCFDKSEIKRVIRNLISNAIKFTDKEGEIQVNLCSNDNEVIISVTDNGCGMTEDEKSRLFQRYSSGAKKLRKIGTGLGLYLSYQIVQAHEGKMWVESEPGKGSVFSISLPKK